MDKDLINSNLIEEKSISIILNGNGKTVEEAITNIFLNLRENIYTEINGYIVHMVPETFVIIDYQIEERVEKFLWFFFPQKRRKYKLMAELEVKVKFIKNKKLT